MNQASILLTILFADIGGSAALYERVGDTEAHRLVADSLTRMKSAVRQHQGKVLRTVGDSVLASFQTVDQAFDGAKAIQEAHEGANLSVRVGFHTGPVIPDGGDVYGHAVNLAARVAAYARVDEIVATADSIAKLSDKNRLTVSSADDIDVKGVPVPVTIHRLQWRDDSVMATRLATPQDKSFHVTADTVLKTRCGEDVVFVGPACTLLRLGRAEDNHIAVLNDEASRYHATVEYRHGQFILTDQSTNGTYVQKSNLQPFLVRRDAIVLDGVGVITLGAAPDQSANQRIEFELVQKSPDSV